MAEQCNRGAKMSGNKPNENKFENMSRVRRAFTYATDGVRTQTNKSLTDGLGLRPLVAAILTPGTFLWSLTASKQASVAACKAQQERLEQSRMAVQQADNQSENAAANRKNNRHGSRF